MYLSLLVACDSYIVCTCAFQIEAPKTTYCETKRMDTLDQYLEDAVSQTNSFAEDKSHLAKWKSATNAIADSDRNDSGGFDCNICLESVQDPVVTLCGHLYCWPCIYKWFYFHSTSTEENRKQQRPQCPVCKTEVSQSSLVPLYGRGQTATPSKGKSHNIGLVIPQRPHGPNAATMVSQPTSRSYHHHYSHHHPQEFNSIRGGYTSPSLAMDGALRNAFDTGFGVLGETIYARIFGNQMTNIYTYPNSYNLADNSNPRIRRHLMKADKQLSRISFFLFCCFVLCLLLF